VPPQTYVPLWHVAVARAAVQLVGAGGGMVAGAAVQETHVLPQACAAAAAVA
jgi:hypothetical protein